MKNIRYWVFKHKPGEEADENSCKEFVLRAVQNNYACMQYEYNSQKNKMVTQNWNRMLEINEGDIIFLRGDQNIYAFGYAIRPRLQPNVTLNAREIIKRNNHDKYNSHGYNGVIHFSDSKVFYENLDEEDNWGQRIDVDSWKFYYPEGIPAKSQDIYKDGENVFGVLKELKPEKGQELITELYKKMGMCGDVLTLLKNNHNIILTGAPGTGKTYLAKQIARLMLFGKKNEDELNENEKKQFNEQCGFVQFHPSYDYTDFVEGLRPVKSEDENGIFERKDGCFKAFCKKAIVYQRTNVSDNFDEAWEKLVDYLNDNDFINVPFLSDKSKTFRTELNEYGTGLASRTYQDGNYQKGEWIKGQSKFFSKDQLYNVYKGLPGVPSGGHDNYRKAVVEKMKESFNLIDYKAGSISSGDKKPFVFIIDEINRGEISKIFGELFFSIDPGYRGIKGKVETQYQNLIKEDDDFYEGFYVPENVYIIGTMNDIDRSVESMDFAFRRRFAFAEIKADENVGMLDDLKWKDEAIERMKRLNEAISKTEGLSSAYHIGASYFMKLKNYKGDFNQLWEYHLEGLLHEYLRGMQGVEDSMKKLKNAYDNANPGNGQ